MLSNLNTKRIDSRNLDFIRTVAVCLVVSRHLMSALNFTGNEYCKPQQLGIAGVLIFFVHTSLVLMMSLERQEAKNGTRFLYYSFLIRRFFRIYPLSMAIVALVLTISVTWPNNPVAKSPSVISGMANFFLVQNIVHTPNIIGPLWSLPIEVQMYFFLPLLFTLTKYVKFKGFILIVWPVCVALALLQFKLPFFMLGDVVKFSPCFIAGIVCYTLWNSRRILPFIYLPLFLLVAILLYQVAGQYSQTIGGYIICLPLGVVLPFFAEVNYSPIVKICHVISRYSYSIYLLHDVCISIVFAGFPGLTMPIRIAILGIFIAGSSLVTYHLIEAPMIVFGNKIATQICKQRLKNTIFCLDIDEKIPAP